MIQVMQVSLVIPLFNEAENVPQLIKSLNKLTPQLPKQSEVIFVDDGSQDRTLEALQREKLQLSKKIIQLSRNFGHQSALLAGLKESTGLYTVTLDGDLQHPLEVIPRMLAEHQKGIEIVLTQRNDQRVTAPLKKLTSHWFYQILKSLSQTPVIENSSDFRSLNRLTLDTLLAMPEHRQFLRGMVNWIGFSSIVIPFQVEERKAGKSKYSLTKMIRLALHGITSFSSFPLYFAGFFSFTLFITALLYAIYVVYIRLFAHQAVSGWASLLFVLLTVGGFLCLFLGIIGIYIAAIYDEVKQRPIYIVKQKFL